MSQEQATIAFVTKDMTIDRNGLPRTRFRPMRFLDTMLPSLACFVSERKESGKQESFYT